MIETNDFIEKSYTIIDAHAHYTSPTVYNRKFFLRQYALYKEMRKKGKSVDQYLAMWFKKTMSRSSTRDTSLGCLMKDMEKAGVKASVLAFTSPQEDRDIDRASRLHQNLYGLFWLNPYNPSESADRFFKAKKANPRLLGMKATLQYHRIRPNHLTLYPLYEKLDTHHMPLQFHVGEPDNFANLDDYGILASQFPNLSIILLHAGGGRWREIPNLLL